MELEKENKEAVIRIAVSAVLLAAAYLESKLVSQSMLVTLLVYLIPYLVIAWDVIKEAFEELFEGEAFNEDLLMVIATVGALLIGFIPGGEPQFAEAVFVMLFFKVGELFEDMAEDNSRRSISHLMDIRPDTAEVLRGESVKTVPSEDVTPGETIVIRPGSKVPMDGIVIEGESTLNTSALTGESIPRNISSGDEILSGCINLTGLLKVKVTKAFSESTASRILSLVEEASERKSSSEAFISRFAKVYTPIVVGIAILLAVVPPIALSGAFSEHFASWLLRALTFLVVSCPCALVISVPLTFFAGLGGASKAGILIKGSNFMDSLSQLGEVVFDKTGTLTEGVFEVSSVHPQRLEEKELVKYAAAAEKFSTHPIAVSLRKACEEDLDSINVENVKEIAGHGVSAEIEAKTIHAGNAKLMKSLGIEVPECSHPGSIVHIASDGVYEGHIGISDKIKEDSKKAVEDLHKEGISVTMLTGDRDLTAKSVADALGIDRYHAELLPEDKLNHLEDILSRSTGKLAFVGDGINDAPSLARADVGFAMGALGSEAAIEAADVVLMDDKPSKVAQAVRISKRTIRIAYQNIVFAIGVKVLVLALAALGLAPMWLAVFADVGVMVIAVANASRALKVQQ